MTPQPASSQRGPAASPHSERSPARALRPPATALLGLLCGLGLSATTAGADTLAAAGDELEQGLLADFPVVLSVTRLAQPQPEAPAAVTVIDRAMIEASAALDIPDLLRLVPGFQVTYASGHQPTATYHGLSSEHTSRMQVLVDGRSVYSPTRGGVFWNDLPLALEDIERIEVVRGPNAAAYGANAFLGAINIVTRHPSEDAPLRARLIGGNKDIDKRVLSHSAQHDNWSYRTTLGYRRDSGFRLRNDDMRVTLATWRSDWQIDQSNQLQFQTGYNTGLRQMGVLFPGPDDYPRDRHVNAHFEQLVWRNTPHPELSHRLQLYHNYRRTSEFFESPLLSELFGVDPSLVPYLLASGRPDQPLTADLGIIERRVVLEYQSDMRVSPSTRVVWGAELRFDSARAPAYFNSEDEVHTQRRQLFGNLEQHLGEDWILNAGAMFENTSLTGSDVSPRLALNYLINDDQSLRLGFSRALRLPTIYEANVDAALRLDDGSVFDQIWVTGGDLRPESIESFELGYLGRLRRVPVSWDLRIFHDRISKRITTSQHNDYGPSPYTALVDDPPPPDRALVYLNTGHIQVNGAEIGLNYRPAHHSMLSFNYSWTRAKGTALDDFAPKVKYEDLGEDVPRKTLSVFAMHRLANGLELSAMYYNVSRMKWLGDGDRLDRQERLDLRVAKIFQMPKAEFELAVAAQSVLHEYIEFDDANVFDTRVYLELGLTWH